MNANFVGTKLGLYSGILAGILTSQLVISPYSAKTACTCSLVNVLLRFFRYKLVSFCRVLYKSLSFRLRSWRVSAQFTYNLHSWPKLVYSRYSKAFWACSDSWKHTKAKYFCIYGSFLTMMLVMVPMGLRCDLMRLVNLSSSMSGRFFK